MTDNSMIPQNMNLRMTTMEIAELTEKNHRDVMRDFRNLIDQGAVDQRNFALISYVDQNNREQPMYSIDYEASMVLVTGYDARRRSVVIKRWLALERGEATPLACGLVPAGMLLIQAEEYSGLKNKVIELLEDKVELLANRTTRRYNFTQEEDDLVVKLVEEGLGAAEIGLRLGRSKESIRSCIRRLRNKGVMA